MNYGMADGIIGLEKERQKHENNPELIENQKVMKKINWKRHLLYHSKWQLSTAYAIPIMYLFVDYFRMEYWLALFLLNLLGAFLFYPIDNFIFNRNKGKVLDLLYSTPIFLDPRKNQLLNDHTKELKSDALREISNPKWIESKEFGDWKYKVSDELRNNWGKLSEDVRLTIYFYLNLKALEEQD